MMRILSYLLILFLSASCTQSRYGHRTVRVPGHTSKTLSGNATNPSDHSRGVSNLRSKHSDALYASLDFAPTAPAHLDALERTRAVPAVQLPRNLQAAVGHILPDREVDLLPRRAVRQRTPQKEAGLGADIWTGIKVLVVVLLFIAALAWLLTLFSIPFWTGFKWIAIAFAVIWLLGALGLTEFWMGS